MKTPKEPKKALEFLSWMWNTPFLTIKNREINLNKVAYAIYRGSGIYVLTSVPSAICFGVHIMSNTSTAFAFFMFLLLNTILSSIAATVFFAKAILSTPDHNRPLSDTLTWKQEAAILLDKTFAFCRCFINGTPLKVAPEFNRSNSFEMQDIKKGSANSHR